MFECEGRKIANKMDNQKLERKAEALFNNYFVEATEVFNKLRNYDDILYLPCDKENETHHEVYFWYMINDNHIGEGLKDIITTSKGQMLCSNIAVDEYCGKFWIGFTWYGIHCSNVEGFKQLANLIFPNLD